MTHVIRIKFVGNARATRRLTFAAIYSDQFLEELAASIELAEEVESASLNYDSRANAAAHRNRYPPFIRPERT